MKKPFISLLAGLLAWAGLEGAPVGRQTAERLASGFVRLGTQSALRSATLSTTLEEAPAYYIFNDAHRQGYVIVSGDDALPPIIGYADSGHIDADRLPIQLRQLLDMYTKQVAYVRSTGVQYLDPEATALRATSGYYMKYPRPVVEPLIKSRWNQSTPYNNLAPKLDNEDRAVSGCVATAMAQLMYYHRWPERGKGSHSYTPEYSNKAYGTLTVDFSQSTYQWSKMRDTYTVSTDGKESWTKEEGDAVARIVYDAGVSVDMSFSPQESGAYMDHAMEALGKYFGYHSYFIDRTSTSGDEFYKLITKELDARRPVLFSGGSSGGAHAWVVDGYATNGFLHVNWGWGGSSDGYFMLDFMSPASLGIGGGAGSFHQWHNVVLATPAKTGVSDPYAKAKYPRLSIFGTFYPTKEQLTKSTPLPVVLEKVGNSGHTEFYGSAGVGIYRERDNSLVSTHVIYDIPKSHALGMFRQYVDPWHAELDLSALSDGKYYVSPISRAFVPSPTNSNQNINTEWQQMEYPMSFRMVVEGSSVRVTERGDRFVLRLGSAPKETMPTWVGKAGSSTFVIQNASGVSMDGDLGMIFVHSNGVSRDTLYTEMYMYAGATSERLISYNTAGGTQLAAGTYTIELCYRTSSKDGQGKTVYTYHPVINSFAPYRITVRDAIAKSQLQVYRFDIYQGSEVWQSSYIDKSDLAKGTYYLNATIYNTSGDAFTGGVRYRLVDVADETSITVGTSSDMTLPAGYINRLEATRVPFDPQALGLKAGHTYRLIVECLIGGQPLDVWLPGSPRYHIGYSDKGNATSIDPIHTTSVKLYPNPVVSTLSVEGAGIARVEVYDLTGVLVASAQGSALAQTIDLGHLSSGIYLVRVHTASGIEAHRIAKQ